MSATLSVNPAPRHRWMVPLAVLTAVVMLVGWFPWSNLLHQQHQIDSAAAQIHAVQRQEAALVAQSKSVDTRAAAIDLAREQYQLVAPGQSLIQVLPGDATGQVSPNSADPGFQPLASPSSATLPTTHSTTTGHAKGGFFSRLARTLEFWR